MDNIFRRGCPDSHAVICRIDVDNRSSGAILNLHRRRAGRHRDRLGVVAGGITVAEVIVFRRFSSYPAPID